MRLSEDQQQAAQRLGQDVCVVAGPGSGKTRVLTERFCWLVREQGISADRILAITFTEKASTNIKRRLVEEFKDDAARREQIERASVSTIHGFCTRLLKENAVAAGVDVDFGVLDEPSSAATLREAADEALETLFAERPGEVRRLMGAVHVSSSPFGRQPDLAESLISVYEAMRVAGTDVASLRDAPPTPGPELTGIIDAVEGLVNQTAEWSTAARQSKRDELLEWLDLARPIAATSDPVEHLEALARFQPNRRGLSRTVSEGLKLVKDGLVPAARARLLTDHFGPLRAVLLEALERLNNLYRERKRAMASLDFSDLEEGALDLLSSRPDVRRGVQHKFDHILMDEMQDTNPLQWQILNLVRRPDRFFAVGDINQSIYSFRHADPDVFRNYRASLEAANKPIDDLLGNYRSRAEILEAVGAVLADSEGVEPRELVAEKDFPSAPGAVVEAVVVHGKTTDEAALKEARWIAGRIREIAAENPDCLSGIAVLARRRNLLKPIEEALNEFRIPCLVVGGRTLFESREVRDLTRFLAVIANTRDEISLAGVLRSPLAGVRDETLLRLKYSGGLWETLAALDEGNATGIAADDVERLGWFAGLLRRLRSNRDAVSPDRLLARIIDESDYEAGLDERARGNVEKFLALVRELHQGDPRPLAELVQHLDRLRQAASEAEAPPGEASNAVQLMSIHGAKGLEFPVVFLPALNRKAPSRLGPVCFSPEHGFGVKWRDPATQEAAGDSVYQAAETTLKQKEAHEQNRLLYVAMTRAEQRLVLSYSTAPRAPGSVWSKLVAERLDVNPGIAGEPERTLPPPATVAGQPEQLLERPFVTGQHDSAVSVTRLGLFLACPRKYYLGDYLGFQQAAQVSGASAGIAAAELGTQVHHLLAGIPVDTPAEEALRLVESFRSSDLGIRIQRATRVEREFDFVMDLEDFVLRGQIDVWFEEDGGLVLVDYKTDQFDPDRETLRLEPYALQLRLYALALRQLTGKLPGEVFLYFLRTGQAAPVSMDDAALHAARETVRSLRAAQGQLKFPLKEGEQCRRCQFYQGMCPAQICPPGPLSPTAPGGEMKEIR